jgi:hypothetical protein
MVPLYIIIRTNGEIWAGNDLVAAQAQTLVANIFAVVNAPNQKITTISGTGSPYTSTPNTFDASRNHVQKLK